MSDVRIDDLPVRDELRGKSPYGAPQLDVPVRLNTNENPYPLPEPLVERIAERVREAARNLNRYPDRDAVELRTKLAEYLTDTSGHEVGLANVWAANGSNEVIQQLLQTFGGPGRTAIGFEPSYSMHGLIARGTGTGWISGPRNDDFTIDLAAAEKAIAEHRPDVVFITTPNNPTGNAVPPETVLALYEAAQAAKPSMVVVNEAYIEFSHGDSLLPLIDGRPNLVISRTMSKAFGAAGLRLGYLAAHPAVVRRRPARPAALPPVGRHPGDRPGRPGAHRHAAGLRRAAQGRAGPPRARTARHRLRRRRVRCQLRAVRQVRGRAHNLAEDPRPGRPGPGQRHPRVAAGVGRHPRRERRVPRRGTCTEEGAEFMSRTGRVERTTKETSVLVEIDLDGTGKTEISTGVGFYDHMLDQLGRHGLFDLTVKTEGDLHIDSHHTIEDTALALGSAFKQALGDKVGIYRFGNCTVPLDESLAQVTVDLSGRPYLVHTEPEKMAPMIGEYDTTMTRHILESFVAQAQIALHVHVPYGRNAHHIVECQFKALARALRYASERDPRAAGILPSTKGAL
ncbi:Imidazoleglycerol-phosphate dehydratase [Streptomyces afghaniensis]